jgi:hypothetical protein
MLPVPPWSILGYSRATTLRRARLPLALTLVCALALTIAAIALL